ncbi:hypothetical protein MVES1_002031 [Malassezia vespertilionis]|uniref:C2 domain-containing protein n=1 Tax=Malassezia vespertilionis TaxID=2020962 RepID=A0A2N1JBS5_9BASI|nr:uncharacterized protein MVES1_002031 [Malassezia vespertilionis]PKI83993.1 hypothetical protein MVES_001924 [Malassezia vespertilionis]WFD06677.1 hypothetical protein MVES1_002031 [Malassezia vespertilionis]
MAQHRMGEGWSSKNKIPTVQQYEAEVEAREHENDPNQKQSWLNWLSGSSENKDGQDVPDNQVPTETGVNEQQFRNLRRGPNDGGGEDATVVVSPDDSTHLTNAPHDHNHGTGPSYMTSNPSKQQSPTYLSNQQSHGMHDLAYLRPIQSRANMADGAAQMGQRQSSRPSNAVGHHASSGTELPSFNSSESSSLRFGAADSQNRQPHGNVKKVVEPGSSAVADYGAHLGGKADGSNASESSPSRSDSKNSSLLRKRLLRRNASDKQSNAPSNDSNRPTDPGSIVSDAGGGEEEKKRIKEAAEESRRGPTNKFTAKGERIVKDPVTEREVVISDSEKIGDVDLRKVDSRYPNGLSEAPLPADAELSDKYTSPKKVPTSSVLLQPFPAPVETDAMKKLGESFEKVSIVFGIVFFCVWAISAFGRGYIAFFIRTAVIGATCVGGYMAIGIAQRNIHKEFHSLRAGMHAQRGRKWSPPMPESVEWLNGMIAVIWKQIDPDAFVGMLDMVEDIMQASLPGFIQAVKISDFGLGANPFRLIAMRALADIMTDPEYPRKTWIEHKNEEENNDTEGQDNGIVGDVQHDERADRAGDFLNMEVSFCYAALPGEDTTERAKNIHLLIEFFLGAFDWIEIPLPIWVQIEQVIGTVRLRAQITSEPPFLRNVTFSLMGVPQVSISAIPMVRVLPNVLDLPLISNFVQSSIAAACNMYVAPKSMTMNMSQILNSDGVKKDTEALGVLRVDIRYAYDLSSQDANGKSDPYCVLSFAKFGRPLYASRIIFEDLNPVWEETAFLLVSQNDLRSDESLSMQLWDSDKHTADDIVGRVNVPLRSLVRKPNEMTDYLSKLMGFEDADSMPGNVKWSAGFFEKVKLNKDLVQHPNVEEMSEAERETLRKPSAADAEQEALALDTPPDPQWRSGILSVIIKHIEGLDRREVEKGVSGSDREGSHGQDVGVSSTHLPSGYCELSVNDNMIFRTRVKQYSNMPYYNAGTEVFVRDWTTSDLRVIVRDSRVREHDPIMGIVDLRLKDLFSKASQIEQAFSIQDGVGYGKVFCSFVFKAVSLKLPLELRGYNTVSVDIMSSVKTEGLDAEWSKKLKSERLYITAGFFSKRVWGLRKHKDVDDQGPLFSIPVYDRYSTLVAFEFGRSPIPGIRRPDAVAILPLRDLDDNQMTEVVLPVFTSKNNYMLSRNYINDQTVKTHDVKEVGSITVMVRVNSGFSDCHRQMLDGQRDKHEFEVYERLVGLPQRAEQNSHANDDGVITRHEKKDINRAQTQELHMRHRGAMGYTPVRVAVWAKDGFKDHMSQLRNTILGKESRDQYVHTEI